MAKKLSFMLAAVAVLAFAIPSMASATVATLPAGTVAPVGTKFTTTGTDFILKSNLLGTITCATLNLNGEITKNNGTEVEASGENSSPTQAGCKNGEKPVKITKFATLNISESVLGFVIWSFTIKIHIGELECTFTGKNINGTYTSGTNVLKFSEASGVTGSPAACGTAKLSGQFALESGSTPLILD
jgi:hypothetical protein